MAEMEADVRAPAAARPVRLSVVVVGLIAVLGIVGLILLVANREAIYGNDIVLWAIFGATSIAYCVSGLAIVRRAPSNAVGWLCFLVAASLLLGLTFTEYAIFAIRTDPRSLPAPGALLAIAEPTPVVALSAIILIVHLFPTGRPIGPRWRLFVLSSVVGAVLPMVISPLIRHRIVEVWSDELSHAHVSARDPLGIVSSPPFAGTATLALALLSLIGALAAVASLVVRRRRADNVERQQLRWLTTIAGVAAAWILVMFPTMIALGPNGPAGAVFWLVATPLVALGPPIAIGIGIVKYRLFDVDVVIRKTVIVTVVAVALLAVYLGVLALATVSNVSRVIVGIALLVVTFNPVRRAATSIADRVAYGRRASSYEVLAGFSRRMAEAYANEDVLQRMASILQSGTGARSATVWLRVGNELRAEATAGEPLEARPVHAEDELPQLPGEAVEVRHDGELLGALSVVMPANDPIDHARRDLVTDMASQAGLVLRNVRLIEELRGSRQRLVAAQDQERRRIERNIHDGAQQQLVALAVKLRLADSLVGRDEEKAHAMLSQLQTEAQEALDDLRDLARGIYPPLLADKGLVAALEAQARKSPLPVSVEVADVGRAGQDVEAATYFCVLEAMQNAAKYAAASNVTVRLAREDGSLRFSVSDDGAGFDPSTTPPGSGLTNMRDRLEALGGSVEVRSRVGGGTRVDGTIPMRATG
ncbi:MAG: sensor histidine kinase [Actinomycetota bacterium]